MSFELPRLHPGHSRGAGGTTIRQGQSRGGTKRHAARTLAVREEVRRACSVLQKVPATDDSINYYGAWPAPSATIGGGKKVPTRDLDDSTGGPTNWVPPVTSSIVSETRAQSPLHGGGGPSERQRQRQPKLLSDIQALISTGLAHVTFKFPDFPNPRDPPPFTQRSGVDTGDFDIAFKEGGLLVSPFAENVFARKGDEFAASRLDVFRQAADALSDNFKSYGPTFRWIIAEHMNFVNFSVTLLKEERQLVAQERDDIRKENQRQTEYIHGLEDTNSELLEQLNTLQSKVSGLEEERDAAVKKCDDAVLVADRATGTIETQEMEKGVLARQILKLEKTVEDFRDKAKQPAKTIQTLRSQLHVKVELITKLGELNERVMKDNAGLRRQVAALQQSRVGSNAPRSVRKLETDLADLLRREKLHDDAIQRLTVKLHAAEREVELANHTMNVHSRYDEKTGVMLTPRPKVSSAALPTGSSTTVVTMEAAAKLERMTKELQRLQRLSSTLTEFRELPPEELKKHVRIDGLPPMVPSIDASRKWFVGLSHRTDDDEASDSASNNDGEKPHVKGAKGGGEDSSPALLAPAVPSYLAASGRIRNSKYTMSQTQTIIRGFRANSPCGDIDPLSLAAAPCGERFHAYCVSKYGTDSASEFAYSFHHALRLHRADPECFLFRGILDGTISEDTWHSHVRLLDEVKYALLDRLKTVKEGALSKLQACTVLAKFFRCQRPDDVGRLFNALNRDFSGEGVDVYGLFRDSVNKPGALVQAILQLLVIDRERYLNSLESVLLDDRDVATGLVTPIVFARTLIAVDPGIPDETFHLTVSTMFRNQRLPLALDAGLQPAERYIKCFDVQVPLKEFVEHMRFCDLKRYSQEPVRLISTSGDDPSGEVAPAGAAEELPQEVNELLMERVRKETATDTTTGGGEGGDDGSTAQDGQPATNESSRNLAANVAVLNRLIM